MTHHSTGLSRDAVSGRSDIMLDPVGVRRRQAGGRSMEVRLITRDLFQEWMA
jgi:hypothetical protein